MCEVMEKYAKEDVEKDDDICASLKRISYTADGRIKSEEKNRKEI